MSVYPSCPATSVLATDAEAGATAAAGFGFTSSAMSSGAAASTAIGGPFAFGRLASSLPSFLAPSLSIDVQIWDLAGQDVYTLSHSVHFSHRSLYLLLWKPGESLDTTMRRVTPWLEALCMHVPDAHVVMVASHCKTNIADDAFLQLSGQVEAAAAAKVQDLRY